MECTDTILNPKIRFNSKSFNTKLINSLPGIFYLYHVTENDVLLKRWNIKHIEELEYSAKELKDISASVFFPKEDFNLVRQAIERVFVEGLADIHTTLITKSGRHIPYYLQGYALEVDGEKYFMGVGIDESKHTATKKKLKKAKKKKSKEKKKKEKAQRYIQSKERELLTMAIHASHTLEIIKEVRNKIDDIKLKYSNDDILKDIREIDRKLQQEINNDNHWEIFKLRFKEIHPEFFNILKSKHPELTDTEIKFCAYLRLHLSTTQIASILSITKEGIKKKRYRIRKKIGLHQPQTLEEYISCI